MKKEITNHVQHIGATFSQLLELLFPNGEIDRILSNPNFSKELLSSRKSWIKTSDLVQEGIITEKMALIHLLWLQHIGRFIIEDADPLSGAILVSFNFKGLEELKPES